MKRRIFFSTLSAVLVTFLSGALQAQVVLEDFEGPLPGPQEYPGGYSYSGGGVDGGVVTSFSTQVTDQEAFSGVQSFQIDIDASNQVDSYFYGGIGGFFGFYGEDFGFAEGQSGEDNPGNYKVSFDLKVQGNNGDSEAATAVGGAVGLYKGDYEVAFNEDLNGDGTIGPVEGGADGGYDIWNSTFVASTLDNDWTHIEWVLDTGTAPTTNGSLVPTPFFDDESTFSFQLFFNSGGFGVDAGNVINIDNMQLEFIAPTLTPGDFNEDNDVDGEDFLAWQRDNGVGSLSDWQANYGAGSSAVSFAATPEPATVWFALSAATLMFTRYRRGRR